MKNKSYLLILIIAILACKEEFTTPVVSPPTGYLVVEGTVNSGNGLTEITLSRTSALDNPEKLPEVGASVLVEGEDNTSYLLADSLNGHYFIESMGLLSDRKYRLYIKTKDGKEYGTDFLEVKNTPKIDSINWERNSDGVQIYANTHDNTDNTRYYHWDYTETYVHNAEFKSYLKINVNTINANRSTYQVVFRDLTNNLYFDSSMYFCWQSYVPTEILIGTTARLSKDEIHFPLAFLPNASPKLNEQYSILVKQYSISKEAYDYLELIKKNTELTGSIFDPQPAVLKGNLYCITDAPEPVIGYISISNVQQKRIFISNKQVPEWGHYTNCVEKVFSNNSNIIRDQVVVSYLPTDVVPLQVPFPGVSTYYAAPRDCVDCRLTGTNTKPDFWPN